MLHPYVELTFEDNMMGCTIADATRRGRTAAYTSESSRASPVGELVEKVLFFINTNLKTSLITLVNIHGTVLKDKGPERIHSKDKALSNGDYLHVTSIWGKTSSDAFIISYGRHSGGGDKRIRSLGHLTEFHKQVEELVTNLGLQIARGSITKWVATFEVELLTEGRKTIRKKWEIASTTD